MPYRDLAGKSNGESSEEIRIRITKSREIQSDRFAKTKIYCNAQMSSRHIKKYCKIDNESENILETAIDKLGFSARAYNRILKISRTIADLEGRKEIGTDQIAEAIQYRSLDRMEQFN